MAFFYFSFEQKVNKILIYFFLILLLMILYFLFLFKKKPYFDYIIDLYLDCISRILLFIPYISYKLCSSKEKEWKLPSNFTSKDWIILVLIIFIDIFYNISFLLFYYFPNSGEAITSIMFYMEEIFTIICLSLLMKFVTNFNFYTHHKFSIILSFLFIIFFGIPEIIKYYSPIFKIVSPSLQLIGIIILCFRIIFKSICSTYMKYLMEQKNITFYLIATFFGLEDLIFSVIIDIILKRGQHFNKHYLLEMIIYTIFQSFLYYLVYKVMFEYNAIYSEIINFIFNIINNLGIIFLNSQRNYFFLVLTIIESFFIVICLFVYVEIIELNFCGLNTNTRRNILIRLAVEQMDLDLKFEENQEDNESKKEKVEFPGGYLVDFNQENENEEISNTKNFYIYSKN